MAQNTDHWANNLLRNFGPWMDKQDFFFIRKLTSRRNLFTGKMKIDIFAISSGWIISANTPRVTWPMNYSEWNSSLFTNHLKMSFSTLLIIHLINFSCIISFKCSFSSGTSLHFTRKTCIHAKKYWYIWSPTLCAVC